MPRRREHGGGGRGLVAERLDFKLLRLRACLRRSSYRVTTVAAPVLQSRPQRRYYVRLNESFTLHFSGRISHIQMGTHKPRFRFTKTSPLTFRVSFTKRRREYTKLLLLSSARSWKIYGRFMLGLREILFLPVELTWRRDRRRRANSPSR